MNVYDGNEENWDDSESSGISAGIKVGAVLAVAAIAGFVAYRALAPKRSRFERWERETRDRIREGLLALRDQYAVRADQISAVIREVQRARLAIAHLEDRYQDDRHSLRLATESRVEELLRNVRELLLPESEESASADLKLRAISAFLTELRERFLVRG